MAQLPDDTSSQNSIGVALSGTLDAGTLISLVSSDGTEIVTFSPAKTFQTVVISSPNIQAGSTYTLYTGGSYSTATATDGLYTGGSYTPGTQAATLKATSAVTSSGSFSQSMDGGNMGGGPGGGRQK
jgi:hypothetical protein